MKKLSKTAIFLLAVILLFSSCAPEEIPEGQQSENEISELGEGSEVIGVCIFKTAEGKYGVQKDGKIVLPATYEELKRVGVLGGKSYIFDYKN